MILLAMSLLVVAHRRDRRAAGHVLVMRSGRDAGPMAQVEIRDLGKLGAVKSVDGVSLDVADGGLVTCPGSSGCGKTTTLRRRRVDRRGPRDGSDWRASRCRASRCGSATSRSCSDYALFPHMTVQDNIAYGLRLRKWEGADRIRAQVERLAQIGRDRRAAAALSA